MWTTNEHQDSKAIGQQLGSAGGLSDGLAGNAIRVEPNGKNYSTALRIAYSSAYLIPYKIGRKGRHEILSYNAGLTNPPTTLKQGQGETPIQPWAILPKQR